jgi:hypothetical protein
VQDGEIPKNLLNVSAHGKSCHQSEDSSCDTPQKPDADFIWQFTFPLTSMWRARYLVNIKVNYGTHRVTMSHLSSRFKPASAGAGITVPSVSTFQCSDGAYLSCVTNVWHTYCKHEVIFSILLCHLNLYIFVCRLYKIKLSPRYNDNIREFKVFTSWKNIWCRLLLS